MVRRAAPVGPGEQGVATGKLALLDILNLVYRYNYSVA
jgi:hypothetical protein